MTIEKEKFKKEFSARLINFAVAVLRTASAWRKHDRNLAPLVDQVIRSAGSIGANVIEAKAASSKKDFIRFFEIALKSANETQYWPLVAKHYDATCGSRADVLLKEADELARIIGSSLLTMRRKS